MQKRGDSTIANRPTAKGLGKKGAILTPFLIIAIVLLIAFSLAYYSGTIRNYFGPIGVAYPVEVEPVAKYIQDCAAQTGAEAVIAIAGQGGYIELPTEISREYDAFMPLDDLNLKVLPFWTFRGASRIPTILNMEGQMGRYIENRTKRCLDNFRALSDRYIITEEGNLSVTATMTLDTVQLSIDYPLKVVPKANLKETRMREFSATVPARLKRMYDLAVQIMQYQSDKLSVENLTIDLMSADPQVPLNHLGVECKQQRWMIEDIKMRIQEVIATNLLTVRVKNTDHVPFEADEKTYQKLAESQQEIQASLEDGEEDFHKIKFPTNTPSDAYEYFHTYWDVGSEKTPMSVAVTYRPEYGMDLSVAPSTNGMIASTLWKGAKNLMGFLCVNAYHFTYTIRYPTRVSIHDPLSFGGKGLDFEFAFPVSISDNQPEPKQTARKYITAIRPTESLCARLGDKFYEIRAIGADEEGYVSNSGIEGANISWRCAGRQCDLGTTRAESGAYALITPMPAACKNPAVIASKDGYIQNEKFLEPELTMIPLAKIRTLEATPKKRVYYATDKRLAEEESLAEDENITIKITAIGGAAGSDGREFTTNEILSGSDPMTLTRTINLIEGTTDYSIDAIMTKGDRIIGGYYNRNLTINGGDAAKAQIITIDTIEYRPTPISDDEEASMAIYLVGGAYKESAKPRLS